MPSISVRQVISLTLSTSPHPSPTDGSGRDHVGEFRISVPLSPEADLAALAAARAEATVALARKVAAEGLR